MAEFGISQGSFAPDYALADDTSVGELTAGLAPPPLPTPAPVPPVGFDEVANKVYVNGFTFDVDDHDSALKSKEALRQPLQPMPANYRPVSPEEFGGYIEGIQNPTIGRLAKKNFGIGVDNLQLLAGRGMQLLGAEETGQAVVDQQIEDLAFNEPYQRLFTDIESTGGAVEWFVANLAQQGPMLIESALSAIAGAALASTGVGAAAFGAVGGLMMKASGKEGVRQAVLAAAKKKLAGEALDVSEEKLLREVASGAIAKELKTNPKLVSPAALGEENLVRGAGVALKRGKTQARAGGAVAGSTAGNYAIGASDIFGEQRDSSAEDNRAGALFGAIPYALAESAPELLGLGFFLRGNKALAKGAKAGRGGDLLRRGGRALAGGGIAAVGEGSTEAFQEALLLGQNPDVDINSAEGIHRLANSFAAGAGVGGALGTAGGALRKTRIDIEGDNVDILNPTNVAPVQGPPLPPAATPVQGELFPDEDLGGYALIDPDRVATEQAELLAERDKLIDEQRRLQNRGDELNATPSPTAVLESTDQEAIDLLSQQISEGNARADTTFGEVSRIAAALAAVDEQLSDPRFAELPGRSAAFAEQLAQQPTLPEVAPVAPITPTPPIVPTAPAVPVDFSTEPTPNEVQDFLAAQEATPNAALAAPLQTALDQARAQQVAAERDAAVRQQRQQQFDEAVSARQTQELDQALEGSVAPVLGEQLELGVLPQGAPRQTGIAPTQRFVNGEEAIMDDVLNEETSEVTQVLVPVRQLLAEAQDRFIALKALERCLGG